MKIQSLLLLFMFISFTSIQADVPFEGGYTSVVDPAFNVPLDSGYYTVEVMSEPQIVKGAFAQLKVKARGTFATPKLAGIDTSKLTVHVGDVVKTYFTEWIKSITLAPNQDLTNNGTVVRGGCIIVLEKLDPNVPLSKPLPLVDYILPAH